MPRSRWQAIAIALVIAVGAFGAGWTVASNGNWKSVPDPDLGLSDAEREAAHDANSDAFWSRYAAWVKEIGPGLDLKGIPITSLLALTADPAASLVDAVDRADLIVRGTIRGVEFLPTGYSRALLAVEDTKKGEEVATVTVASPCSLQPKGDWSIDSIACAESMPMLYPGDEVILLLRDSGLGDGTFTVEPWSGTYWIRAGSVHPVDGNLFGPTVNQTSAGEFLESIGSIAS